MKVIVLIFGIYFTILQFNFAEPLEVDILEKNKGYVSVKFSGTDAKSSDFYLSCFSIKPDTDSGRLISSIKFVIPSNEQKLKIISPENHLEIKKNNKGEYQIISSGAFLSSSTKLHLSLHHLIRTRKAEGVDAGNLTIETVVVLSTDPDERLTSYLSSKPWLYVEKDFFEIIEKYRATVLTIYNYQL